MPFLEDFIKIHEEAESPTSFFYWSGLAAIAAVVRKNVYVNKKIYKLYPNLYVMLIAKSGARKGFPVKQAQKLVESVEVLKVISGQNSIQGIIKELSRQWTLESGKIFRDAQAFIVNDELDSLLVEDRSAQTLLTTLFDSFYHEKWEKTLKHDTKELLDKPHFTMLTATNPEHLDNFLDKASIKGGFLGRTLMVYEEKKSKINPLIDHIDLKAIDTEPLTKALIEIAEIKGQFAFTTNAATRYKEWYIDFYRSLENGDITDETGTAERAGDYVLKLAMLISIDDTRNALVIDIKHIEKAIDLFYDASRSTKRIVEGKGKSEMAEKNRIVLEYLLSKSDLKASRKQILSAKYGDLDSIELSRVGETLTQAGIIEAINDDDEGVIYKISDRYAEKFKKRLENS